MSDAMSETEEVLTFTLGEETYCTPIKYVAEIVKESRIRRIPNTAQHVKGVTDLRGDTTTIIDPVDVLETTLSEQGTDNMKQIIVLDTDALGLQTPTGWLVSQVKQVVNVSNADVDTSVTATNEYVHGFLKQDTADEFIIWIAAHELTT